MSQHMAFSNFDFLLGAVDRRPGRQRHIVEETALILIRHKARWQVTHYVPNRHHHGAKHQVTAPRMLVG